MERTDSVDINSHHEDVGSVDYAGSHEDDEGNSLQCTNKLCINCCSILKFDSATYRLPRYCCCSDGSGSLFGNLNCIVQLGG